MDRWDLNSVIHDVGRAMFTLEGWERLIELELGDAQRHEKAMIIRAHLLLEAAFDQLKDLRDKAMLTADADALVTPAGRFRPLSASSRWKQG